MKNAVICLATGFEEIEAVGVIDVLRRADMNVIVASVDDEEAVVGSHNLCVETDCGLSDIDARTVDAVILPGGMPGAKNLASNDKVLELIRDVYGRGRYVCAICAAPMALSAAGILKGKRVTCYPGFEDRLEDCSWTGEAVTVDGNVITGKGPGKVFDFALKLVEIFCNEDSSAKLSAGMLVTE